MTRPTLNPLAAPLRLTALPRRSRITPDATRLAVAWFVALVVVGLATRWWVVKDRPLSGYLDNEDAAAHVIATSVAYTQTPASAHRYLPIFTLGRPTDKGIDDLPGASAADRHGNYYYTSFPPLGFVVPHAIVHTLTGKPLTPASLRRVNLGLHGLLLGVSVWLFSLALGDVTADRTARLMGAVAAGVVLCSAREMLGSYAISYWAHQLYQVIFALQLVCLCTRRVGIGFAVLCVAGCLTEWTAYVVNAGVVVFALLKYRAGGDRRDALAAGIAAGATVAGGLLLLAWVTSVVSLPDYLASLTGRFTSRQGEADGLVALATGYVRSAGPFVLLALLAGLRGLRPLADCEGYDRGIGTLLTRYPRITTVGALVAWSLVENVLLVGHATFYTFDRIKFVYLLAVVAAVLVARSGSRTLLFALLFAGTLTTFHFAATARAKGPFHQAWCHHDTYFGHLARMAAPAGNELVFTNQYVRGAKIYYAGRNVVEIRGPNHPKESLLDVRQEVLARSRAAGVPTAVVILMPDLTPVSPTQFPPGFPGLPKVYRLDVATGGVTELSFPVR
jgi:hypothetical protein